MSTPSPYCGRLDEHAEHWWTRPAVWIASWWRIDDVPYQCPGTPVVEGGAEVNERGGG